MPLLPLLHAADAVANDGPFALLLLAGTVFAFSAAGTYAALRMRNLLRRPSGRRRAAVVAGATLTLLAMLPATVPFDHVWAIAGDQGEHASVHAAHCHGSPASCSDTPLSAVPGQIVGADPLIVLPPMLSVMLLVLLAPLSGITRRPELRPPLVPLAVR
jgi:hypothetical protein